MSRFCRNKLTPLQRRAFGWLSVVMLLTVAANFLTQVSQTNPLTQLIPSLSALVIRPGHAPLWAMVVVMAVMVLPVLLAVAVVARYLRQEPDEFIRSMVMRALLWGVACTMVADAIATVLMAADGNAYPIGLINADVFVLTAMFSFRLITWRYTR